MQAGKRKQENVGGNCEKKRKCEESSTMWAVTFQGKKKENKN